MSQANSQSHPSDDTNSPEPTPDPVVEGQAGEERAETSAEVDSNGSGVQEIQLEADSQEAASAKGGSTSDQATELAQTDFEFATEEYDHEPQDGAEEDQPVTFAGAVIAPRPGSSGKTPAAPPSSEAEQQAGMNVGGSESHTSTSTAATTGTSPMSSVAGGSTQDQGKATPRSRQARMTSADAPGGMERTLGLACVVLGIGFAAAAAAMPGLAQSMGALGDPLTVTGALVASGMVLFGLDVVRKSLWKLRGDVEFLSNETLRLDQLVQESSGLRQDVRDVNQVAVTLCAEMNEVRGDIVRLTKIASDPSFKSSMFRLAASQDQLAERLDVAMQKRHDALEAQVRGMVEKVDEIGQETASRNEGTCELIAQQRSDWESALASTGESLGRALEGCTQGVATNQSALESLRTEFERRTEELAACVDKARSEGQGGWQELASQVENLGQSLSSATEEARSGLQGTSAAIESAQDAARQWNTELGECVLELDQGRREELEGLRQTVANLQGELCGAIEESGRKAHECAQEVASKLEESHAELAQSVHLSTEESRQGAREVVAELERQHGELATAFTSATERSEAIQREALVSLEGQREAWSQAVESTGEQLAQVVSETSSSVEAELSSAHGRTQECLRQGLETLEGLVSDCRNSLQEAHAQSGAKVVEELRCSLGELQEQLHSSLCELAAGDEGASLQTAIENLDQRFEQRCRELSADLASMGEWTAESFESSQDRIGSKLEDVVRERCDGISEDLMELAELTASLQPKGRTSDTQDTESAEALEPDNQTSFDFEHGEDVVRGAGELQLDPFAMDAALEQMADLEATRFEPEPELEFDELQELPPALPSGESSSLESPSPEHSIEHSGTGPQEPPRDSEPQQHEGWSDPNHMDFGTGL